MISFSEKNGMNADNQSGAVLIVGLVLLLIMTLIGVSATTVTLFDEKLGSSLRDKDTSMQAAEAAISAGERWLRANQHDKVQLRLARDSTSRLTGGQLACTDSAQSPWSDVNSVELAASEYDATSNGVESPLAVQPRFLREKVGRAEASDEGSSGYGRDMYIDTYRISARAAGRASNALGEPRSVTQVQSYFSLLSQP